MPAIVPKFERGPVTYEVVESVPAGRLVEGRAASKVGLAAAGSLVVLGVATTDAKPLAATTGTDAFGNQTLTLDPIDQYTAVGGNGAIYPVEYAADAAFGAKLIAAASGKVTPAGATPDARTIVGECREPGGVVVATKAIGLAKVY